MTARPHRRPTRRPAAQTAPDCLLGGGEMGALMRAHDWSATPLGPVAGWPQSLRTAVSILLDSRYPMLVLWGPEYVQLYNDAYRPVLGATKHPRALGQRGRECWPEIWHVIGPMFDRVMTQGEATWSEDLLFILDRNGYLEETYFTFCYSAIRDESGGVGGVLVTCVETTGRVLGERRLRMLRDLAAGAAACETVMGAFTTMAGVLANHPDLPFAVLFSCGPGSPQLAGCSGLAAEAAGEKLRSNGAWPLEQARDRGGPLVVRDFPELGGGPDAPGGFPHTAVVLPVAERGGDQPVGFLVAGVNPRRSLDDDYLGFLALVAGHVATAIGNGRAHQEERHRAEVLAELDRAKTAFFSNVSHEFRTPLTLLLGPSEEALADSACPLPPAHRERFEMVRRNALRLRKLVNTLLEFSRLEAGRINAAYEPTDLAAFTTELASSFRSAIERAGLRFDVSCPALPGPVYVDHAMWEHVVLNLLSNAFKFTLAGEISLKLRGDGARAILEVRDTGVGIPDHEIPRLFERFHQVRSSRARSHEGTGIGLALVQQVVQLHGGTVHIASAVGSGSTFTVTLPAGPGHLPAEQVKEASPASARVVWSGPYVEEALRWLPDGGEPSSAAPGAVSEARVFVVDDNADMRQYLTRLLGERWTVTPLPDGAALLAAARANPPDLILADIMMPVMDGLELVKRLRADPGTMHVPVILLSARAGEESRLAGLEMGVDDYMVKPFSARELVARVGAHLDLARVRREAERRLEERVQARTAELAAANLQLRGVITERVQAESALRAERDLVRRLMETSPAGILRLDREGRITFANPQSGKVLGLPVEEAIQRRYNSAAWQVTTLDGDPVADEDLVFRTVMRTGAPVGDVRYSVARPDGRRVAVRVNAAPLFDEAGEFDGMVTTVEDITELIRAESTVRGLHRLTMQLTSSLEVGRTLEVLVRETIRLLEASGGCAGLVSPQGMECRVWIQDGWKVPQEYCWPPGHGFPGWVLEHRAPYVTNAAGQDPQAVPELCERYGITSVLCAPILDEMDQPIGFFAIHNRLSPDGFTANHVDTMMAAAQAARLAIGNALAYKEMKASTASLRLLEAISAAANQANSPRQALQLCLNRVCEHSGWPVGHAYWWEGNGANELIPSRIWHLEDPVRFQPFCRVTDSLHFRIGEGLPGQALVTGRASWLPDVREDRFIRRAAAEEVGIRSAVAIPVKAGTEVVAVLEFFSQDTMVPDPSLLDLVEHIGTQLGRVIERQRAADAAHRSRRQLQYLSQRLLEIQESERRAVARELHDEIGQTLTALKLDIESVQRMAGPTPAAPLITECSALVERTLGAVRDLSVELRPSLLDDLGLGAAVRWYVDRQARRFGFRARVSARLPRGRLPTQVETACFRIVQEAITNIARHSHASEVSVEVARKNGMIRLSIRDDGRGFDVQAAWRHAAEGHSLGLLGMQERAALLGGELQIESAAGRGTRLSVQIPLDPPA